MLFLPSPVASGKCASRESCKVRNMYLHAACAHQVNSTLAGHFCPPVRAKRGGVVHQAMSSGSAKIEARRGLAERGEDTAA